MYHKDVDLTRSGTPSLNFKSDQRRFSNEAGEAWVGVPRRDFNPTLEIMAVSIRFSVRTVRINLGDEFYRSVGVSESLELVGWVIDLDSVSVSH